MRFLKLLKPHAGYVAAIIILLFIQAFAELSIPKITADIVDVGIAHYGVETAVPDTMRASTFEAIADSLSGQDKDLLRSSFDADGDAAVKINGYGLDHSAELESVLLEPFAAMAGYSFDSGGMDDPQVRQAALAGVAQEYRAMGVDLSSVQLRYLLSTGFDMLGMTCLMAICAVAVGFLASRLSSGVGRDLRNRLFSHVVRLSDKEVNSLGIASLITRTTNDVQQVQTAIAMGLRMVVYSPLLAVGGIIMVAGTCISMTWTIALAIAAIALILALFMKLTIPRFKRMQMLIDRMNGVSREALMGMPVIRAFCRQREQGARFDSASSELMRTQLFTGRAMASMMPAMSLVMSMVSVLIVWVGASYIDLGAIQVGDLIAFITYSMVVIMSFLMIGMVAVMLPRAEVAAQRVDEVLATSSSIPDAGDIALPGLSGGVGIEFDGVSFSYRASGEQVLSGVSFTVPQGSTMAIVGATGSGKSTVLKLIERFLDVQEGSVRIGGVNVRDIPLQNLRSMLAYVPQNAFLFNGSVAQNIAYGCPGASDDAIRAAARTAQADSFIRELSDGYDTVLSEGGTSVSGGQRQRLSIARALICDARAYLFDDCFSALDSKTDVLVREGIRQNLAGKTVVIVAQRISTIMDADCIVVLDDGCVVGCGTHDELMADCAVYRQIAHSQLSECSSPASGGRVRGVSDLTKGVDFDVR